MHGSALTQKCVEELVLHSIQKSATCIAVRLDLTHRFLQVIDNGKGTLLTEIHELCSRVQPKHEGEESITKNHLGEALYLINRNCSSVEIESQVRSSTFSYKRCYQKGIWSNTECIGTRSTAGTTVSLHDICLPTSEQETANSFFYPSLEKVIASFFLLHPYISFSLRFDPTKPPLLQTKREKNTILAAQQLFRLKGSESILPFRGLSCHFKIKGLLVQDLDQCGWFVFVNSRLVESAEVFSFISSVLMNVTSNKGQPFSIILNIKCSRAAYKFAISPEGNREVKFLYRNELWSLVQSSLDQFTSLAPIKKKILVARWLAAAYSDDLIKSNLVNSTLDDCNVSQRPHRIINMIMPGNSSPLPCETSLLPSTQYYGKITHSVPFLLISHAAEDSEMRIKQSPHLAQYSPPSCLLSPNYLTRLWDEDDQMEDGEVHQDIGAQLSVEEAASGSTFNPEANRSEIRENSSKRLSLKRRKFPNDDDFRFGTKRRFNADRFWIQPKLPPNIAANNLNGLLSTALQRQCKFTKSVMNNISVINQVDQKFICCVTEEEGKRYLVLVDQHAAHERVCLERLMQMHSSKNIAGYIQVESSPIQPPLALSFHSQDLEIIQKLNVEFTRYGLHMQSGESGVLVTRVPACFLEREITEVQRKRNSLYKDLVMALIEETISEFTKNGRLGTCILPVQIRNVLNSLACHGAIRFGDELSLTQCTQLVRALGQCDVPFQCAHGRPLLAPLLELGELSEWAPFGMITDVAKPKYTRLRDYNLT